MKNTCYSPRLLAALLLCLPIVFGSCVAGSPSAGSTASSGAAIPEPTAPTETTADPFTADDLPVLDFHGETVDFLVGDYMYAFWNDFYAEENTGSRLNDTVYAVTEGVCSRLNIRLNHIQKYFDSFSKSDFSNMVTQTILADASDYDVIASLLTFTVEQMSSPYFIDLTKNKYVDLEKPYWNSTVLDAMPTDAIHFATGDGTLAAIKHTMCIFFNQTMLQGNSAFDTDLYELVESGGWTLDKLAEYSEIFYEDLNGDGNKNYGDSFGLTFGDANKYLGFVNSLGVTVAQKTDDGYEITYGTERAVNALLSMCRLVHENAGVWRGLRNNAATDEMISSGGGNYVSKAFVDGSAAFMCGLVQDASTIVPSVNFDYGILPYPKLDESQTEYYSALQRNCYFVIPSTASDTEISGAFLEAWSSAAFRVLQPEYFETTLKTRYSSDEGMARMYDMLRETLLIDIGDIFSDILGNPRAQFREYIISNNTNWASYTAKMMSQWQQSINSIEIQY